MRATPWVRVLTVVAVLVIAGLVAVFALRPRSGGSDRAAVQPADYAAVFDGLGRGGTSLNPNEAGLVGPHFAVHYSGASTGDREPTGRFRAAPGHEFLFLYGIQGNARAFTPESTDKVGAAVVVDGVTRPLLDIPVTGLVVSVPTGHDATLVITDDGRAQSLDVQTGKRGGDAVPVYYRPHALGLSGGTTYKADAVARFAGHLVDPSISIDLAHAGASVEPWVPGAGWAPAGRAWVRISTVYIDSRVIPHENDVYNVAAYNTDYVTDFAKTFVLTVPGGPPVPAEPGSAAKLLAQVGLLFNVADSFTAGTLVIHPDGTLRHQSQSSAVVWSQAPPTGQVALATAH
jgi:hypothetical protein